MKKYKSFWDTNISDSTKIEKGIKIKLSHVWSYLEGCITDAKDIELITENSMTLAEALVLLESAALEFVQEQGAKDIRQYFIEGISIQDDFVEFHWGT